MFGDRYGLAQLEYAVDIEPLGGRTRLGGSHRAADDGAVLFSDDRGLRGSYEVVGERAAAEEPVDLAHGRQLFAELDGSEAGVRRQRGLLGERVPPELVEQRVDLGPAVFVRFARGPAGGVRRLAPEDAGDALGERPCLGEIRRSRPRLAALRQHLLGVLAQTGDPAPGTRDDTVDLEQRTEQLDLADVVVLDAVDEPVGPRLLVLE